MYFTHLNILPGVPLVTVDSAARLIDRSDVAAGSAINRLAKAGILTQRNIGKQRYRIFEGPEVLELFASLERALASPTGGTAAKPPVRPVPGARDDAYRSADSLLTRPQAPHDMSKDLTKFKQTR